MCFVYFVENVGFLLVYSLQDGLPKNAIFYVLQAVNGLFDIPLMVSVMARIARHVLPRLAYLP